MKGITITAETLKCHADAHLAGVDYCLSCLADRKNVPWSHGGGGKELDQSVFEADSAMRYLDAIVNAHNVLKRTTPGGLLTATPRELERVAEAIESMKNGLPDAEGRQCVLIDELMRHIFNYDHFLNGRAWQKTKSKVPHVVSRSCAWSAQVFLDEYDINTCLYCNQGEVSAYRNTKGVGRHPPFDHYLPHRRYPYLGLSLRNLIPSCWRCNSELKGDSQWSLSTHAHPYCDDMDSALYFWACVKDQRVFEGRAEKGDVVIALFRRNKDRSCQARCVTEALEVVPRYNADKGVQAARFIAQICQMTKARRGDLRGLGIPESTIEKTCLALGLPKSRDQINTSSQFKLKFDLAGEFLNGD